MPEAPLKYLQKLRKKPAPADAEPDAVDERDATIERLTRELAEEAEHTVGLRKTIDELRFQAQTLETSYAKQLESARLQTEKAEQLIEEEKARTVAAETERDEALQALKEAQGRIERLTAGADLVGSTAAGPAIGLRGDAEEISIDAMLADASIAPESEQDKDQAPAPAEPEEPAEDMLSPDLVFAAKDDT